MVSWRHCALSLKTSGWWRTFSLALGECAVLSAPAWADAPDAPELTDIEDFYFEMNPWLGSLLIVTVLSLLTWSVIWYLNRHYVRTETQPAAGTPPESPPSITQKT